MHPNQLSIDLNESFEHLPNAPIVEAVIHWRSRPGVSITPDHLLTYLKGRLPDYPNPQNQTEIKVDGELSQQTSSVRLGQTWQGFRFESSDKKVVAQFTRDGLVVSRLAPYANWEQFECEALKLWGIYCELLGPPEVERLGVRFINRIYIRSIDELSNILVAPPVPPSNLPIPPIEFMHQTRYEVAETGYRLNVNQALLPPALPTREEFGLILDLDVYTIHPMPISADSTSKKLAEMRWIKNKAFFSYLKKDAIERFRK